MFLSYLCHQASISLKVSHLSTEFDIPEITKQILFDRRIYVRKRLYVTDSQSACDWHIVIKKLFSSLTYVLKYRLSVLKVPRHVPELNALDIAFQLRIVSALTQDIHCYNWGIRVFFIFYQTHVSNRARD